MNYEDCEMMEFPPDDEQIQTWKVPAALCGCPGEKFPPEFRTFVAGLNALGFAPCGFGEDDGFFVELNVYLGPGDVKAQTEEFYRALEAEAYEKE